MHLFLTRDGSHIGEFRPKNLQRLPDDRMSLRPLKQDQLLFLLFCSSDLRHRRTGRIRLAQFDDPESNRLTAKTLTERRKHLNIVGLLQHASSNRRLFGKSDRHKIPFDRDQPTHFKEGGDIWKGMGDFFLELFPVQLHRLRWASQHNGCRAR